MAAVGSPPLLGWNCNWGVKRGQANLLASSEHRWCGIVESLQRSALWSWSDELLSVWAEARLPRWELLYWANLPEAPRVCWHTHTDKLIWWKQVVSKLWCCLLWGEDALSYRYNYVSLMISQYIYELHIETHYGSQGDFKRYGKWR